MHTTNSRISILLADKHPSYPVSETFHLKDPALSILQLWDSLWSFTVGKYPHTRLKWGKDSGCRMFILCLFLCPILIFFKFWWFDSIKELDSGHSIVCFLPSFIDTSALPFTLSIFLCISYQCRILLFFLVYLFRLHSHVPSMTSASFLYFVSTYLAYLCFSVLPLCSCCTFDQFI